MLNNATINIDIKTNTCNIEYTPNPNNTENPVFPLGILCPKIIPEYPHCNILIISKNIKLVPKVYIDRKNLVYVIIRMRNFTPNGTNPEFRDTVIEFDIICHYD